MRILRLLLLVAGWSTAGCSIFPDDYRDPYARSYEFGYYYGLPLYQQPYAYYHRCYGIFGPDGSCIYYRPPYVPVPGGGSGEDRVIPVTQPPIMAVDRTESLWRDASLGHSGRRTIAEPPPAASVETRALRQPARTSSSQRTRSVPRASRSTPRPAAPRSTSRPTSGPRAPSRLPEP